MTINALTGNRVLLKIDGKPIGVLQNATFSDDLGLQKVSGLSDAEGVELVHGEVSHSITAEKVVVLNQDLISLGLVPTSDQYLSSPSLTVEVIDKISGKTVEVYSGCKVGSHSRNYTKHAIVMENVSIQALHKGQ